MRHASLFLASLTLLLVVACASAQPASQPSSTAPSGTATAQAPASASSSATAAQPSPQPATAPSPGTPASYGQPSNSTNPLFNSAAYAKVPGIVDPTNFGWPRRVKTPTGDVEIKQKPQRIHTLSLGADEITLAFVPPTRVAAVGTFTANPDFSNVADLVKDIPKIKRDAESILVVKPDLVLVSQFTKADLVKQLQDSGITVAMAEPPGSDPAANVLEGYETTIRYLAYLYGEEERAERLITQVRSRLERVQSIVATKPANARPRVLFYQGKKFAHGKGTNADGIIQVAGGINVAAEAGINRAQEIGLEAIALMKPDVILVWLSDLEDQRSALTSNPALADVPAIKNGRIHALPPKQIDTLSHWNARGIEELAKLLWPDDFAGAQFEPFH